MERPSPWRCLVHLPHKAFRWRQLVSRCRRRQRPQPAAGRHHLLRKPLSRSPPDPAHRCQPDAIAKPSAPIWSSGAKADLRNWTILTIPQRNLQMSPETCGEVFFTIKVGDVVLTRSMTASWAFPKFLRDLRGGERTFTLNDHPLILRKAALERLGSGILR